MISGPLGILPTTDVVPVSEELKAYFSNKFRLGKALDPHSFTNEPYIESWEEYAAIYQPEEAFQLLKTCYPQFDFPIEEGINKTPNYLDAVLKGKQLRDDDARSAPLLHKPEQVKFTLYASIAGKVPVLTVADEDDFVNVIQCLLHKNNPATVPRSMGALLANGINNWDRVRRLKANWVQHNPIDTWGQEFSKNVLPNPDLYKDKLIILSTKPYSAVKAASLGLTEPEWADLSYTIRLEHECVHLYTLKRYGCASNNLHDELVADYIGIAKATGDYHKEWMLTCMGLEDYPAYRAGARLENYLKDAGLNSGNFRELISVIKRAIDSISGFDTELGSMYSEQDKLSRIDALCMVDLLDISSRCGKKLLIEAYSASMSKYS